MSYKSRFVNKIGSPPGTATYVGSDPIEKFPVKLLLHSYQRNKSENTLETTEIETSEITRLNLEEGKNYWLEIFGNHDEQVLKTIGKHFKWHPLLLEDVLNSRQQPKLDNFGDQILIVLRRSYDLPETVEFESEQISIILQENICFSVTELQDDFFEPIKTSIKRYSKTYSNHSIDFLAYSLIDYIIDTYYVETLGLENFIEEIETKINEGDLADIKQEIYSLRRTNMGFRRLIWPLRELASNLRKLDSDLISDAVKAFLRDLNDHLLQIIDIVEINRDLITSLKENYSTELSNRMNEIMFTLTILSTIILPMTFITSLYGMNFENIPELSWKYGYLFVWVLMLALASSFVYMFKRLRWM